VLAHARAAVRPLSLPCPRMRPRLSRWMGHKSITETADTYGHLYPEADNRAREAVDATFARQESLMIASER
jgi:hypothetical protein